MEGLMLDLPYFPTNQEVYGVKLNNTKNILKTRLRETVQWHSLNDSAVVLLIAV